MTFSKENSLAIVLDIQERLLPAIHNGDEVISRCVTLIKGLKEIGVPLIVTEQYSKGLGGTVWPIKDALGDFTPLEKLTFNALQTESIKAAISESGRKNIILIGTETHICIMKTLTALIAEGYNVILPTDCVGSRKPSDKESGIARAIFEGAVPSCCESVLFELLDEAKGPTFKAISRLIK